MHYNSSNAEQVRFDRILAREKLMPAQVDMATVRNALEALGPVIQKGSRGHGKEDKKVRCQG
ncbi:hypothetical protein FVEN_g12938 [Fusarium venenatum]|nr:hypothetical protein FVEN_g12938 [Fusarium venenatum]